ncbi:MAG: hypothetical protein U0359_06410 [Byssovorax sp.]
MITQEASHDGYVVPSYRAHEGATFYHFLHGNVPSHQIDFMYCAEVPQGPLTRQHFSHLSRLMKYIEPQSTGAYAFAIGNLSRDDIQHEPGHGGMALIFGLRIRGTTDHAGRQDPPFAHAIVAVDRQLDADAILDAARLFHQHVLGAAESAGWYRSYVRCMREDPAHVSDVLGEYMHAFRDLPAVEPSSLSLRWTAKGAPQPRRIVIAHDDGAPFEVIARAAARIAAVLYASDIRWTVISNGREADLPNGVSIRFVSDGDLTAADLELGVRRVEDVPIRPEEIAKQLFGAAPFLVDRPTSLGWRARLAQEAADALREELSVDTPRPSWEGKAPPFRPPTDAAIPRSRRSPPPRVTPVPVVDEDATTLWKSPPDRSSAPDVEISVDEDAPPRRAVLLPIPAAAAEPAPEPRASEPGLEADWNRSGRPRETMVISPEQAAHAVKAALPFVPAKPAPSLRPVTSPQLPPAVIDAVNFRSRNPLVRWTVMTMAAMGLTLVLLYVGFSEESPPAAPTASAASAPATAATTSAPEIAAATSTSAAPSPPAAPTVAVEPTVTLAATSRRPARPVTPPKPATPAKPKPPPPPEAPVKIAPPRPASPPSIFEQKPQ